MHHAQIRSPERIFRLAVVAFFSATTAFVPLLALSRTAGLLDAAAFALGLLLVGRRSPLMPMLQRRAWARSLAELRIPRVDVPLDEPGGDVLVGLLLGGMSWFLPMFVAAYALDHGSFAAEIGALLSAVIVSALFGAYWLRPRGPRGTLALGTDGVSLPDGTFLRYGAIHRLATDADGITFEVVDGETSTSHRERVDPRLADALKDEIEARQRNAAGATTAEGSVAAIRREQAGHREPSAPIAEWTRIVADGLAEPAERLRIAEQLRVAAPEIAEELAGDTADHALARTLRGERSRDE